MSSPPTDPPPSNRRAKLPNALTLSRIALAALFFAVLSLRAYLRGDVPAGSLPDLWLLSAAGIFIIAAITDALDGFFARRWDVISTFGRIMDPFADKVLVLGAFVYLAGPGFLVEVTFDDRPGTLMLQASGVSAWMVVTIIARELLVTSIRGVLEGQGIDFSAGWAGKWKMILQSVVIPLILVILALTPALPESIWRHIIDVLVWVTVIVTVWSGIPYVTRALSIKKDS